MAEAAESSRNSCCQNVRSLGVLRITPAAVYRPVVVNEQTLFRGETLMPP